MWDQISSARRTSIKDALDGLAAEPDPARVSGVRAVEVGQRHINLFYVGQYAVLFKQEDGHIVVVDIARRAQIDVLRSTRQSTAA